MRARVIVVAVFASASLALAVYAARREILDTAEVLPNGAYLDQAVSCALIAPPVDAGSAH